MTSTAPTSNAGLTEQLNRNRPAPPDRNVGAYHNVGEDERAFSVLGGIALSLYGLRRGSWLGAVSFLAGASLLHRGWKGYCTLYDQLGINTTAGYHPHPGVRAQHGVKVERSIHVERNRQDVYKLWRNLENLPHIMRHLKSVTPINQRRSQWVANAPLGQTLQWEAEIINDRPGEVIAWRSVSGSQVDTAGSVHFSDSASAAGTIVTVSLKYDPPGGQVAAKLGHLLGQGLEQDLEDDLRRFKRTLETDESTSAAQQNR